MNREKKRMTNPSLNHREVIPSQKVSNVGGVVKRDIFKGSASQIMIEKAKAKKKDYTYVTGSEGSDTLILSWFH